MYIIKVFGIVLVFTASVFIGFLNSASLVKRSKKIALLLDGTAMLYKLIEQGGFEIEKALKIAFSKCDFLIFNDNKILCDDSDLKDDKLLIEDFFRDVGNATKKAECDRINYFKLKFESRFKEAENNVAQKSKIYQMFGICAGLAISILLI